MQLETVTPPHRPLAVSGKALEYPIGIAAQVMADWNHRGIHEADAGAFAEGGEVEEEHHLEEHTALQLHKAVVGHGIGKIGTQMLPDEEQVVMLEVAERSEMKRYQNGHNLAIGKRGLTVATNLACRGHKRLFIHFNIKFFAKFIHSTENFCNFVGGNHENCSCFDL